MSNNFQLLYKQDEAHDDSIWTITWCKCGENGIEYILTGGADGIVKSWKWIDNKIIEDNKMMGKNLNYHFFGFSKKNSIWKVSWTMTKKCLWAQNSSLRSIRIRNNFIKFSFLQATIWA